MNTSKLRVKADTAMDTRAQFEAEIDACCRLQLEIEELVVKRDRELAELLAVHEPVIQEKKQLLKAKVVLCEKYATIHQTSIFGKAKTAVSSLGVFGFRLGNPTLKLLNRRWKWDDVVAAIQGAARFELLRVKTEPDKDAIKKLPDDEQAAFGVRTEQEDVFYIEPRRDDPDRMSA